MLPSASGPPPALRVVTAFLLACCALASPASAKSKKPAPVLEGFWDGPSGRLELKRKGDKVGGVLVAGTDASPFQKTTFVLEGTFFEDNLTAEVRLGVVAPACGLSEKKAFVMLLLTRSGKLTGGVSSPEPCAKDVSSITFFRAEKQSPGAAVHRAGDIAPVSGDIDAVLREGLGLLETGRFEAARKVFLRGVELAPARGEAYNGVGVTFALRREWREAIEWYKKGLEAAPGFGDLYYNLACAYSQMEKPKMALRYLKLSASKGWSDFKVMDADPDLANLRASPEYAEIRSLMESPLPPPPP